MAFVFSSVTRVYFNGLDISGYLNAANLEGSVEVAEATTFGYTGKVYVPGLRDRSFSSSGHYDPTAQAFLEADLLAGSGGVLTFCPGGAAAIGDLAWLSSVISTSMPKSSNISDVVAFDWDAQTTGHTAFGYVLHPLAEDTNTTTGATRDDAAATATGWAAHLHVPALDAGSWVIELEDSANGSAWLAVSGGAFTAVTGATQQRLVSAAGAALRRYVRYTATRTGGAGGDGITFHLSVSHTYVP